VNIVWYALIAGRHFTRGQCSDEKMKTGSIFLSSLFRMDVAEKSEGVNAIFRRVR
jgi:hypothetical protein